MRMNIQNMNRKTRIAFAVGNFCLPAGLLIFLFVHPAGQLQRDWAHGIAGLLLGVAIAIAMMRLYRVRNCRAAGAKL